MSVDLPKKLKEDAIVEALLEVRFESDDIGEIVIGRLNDFSLWNDFQSQRLPHADIPEVIRESDPNLRYSSIIERRGDNTAVRIGPRSISFHAYAPYIGWDELSRKLEAVVSELFAKLKNLRILRLGLRYINLIEKSRHKVNAISSLELSLEVANKKVVDGLNISFQHQVSDQHIVMTRVASPQFIMAANLPEDVSSVIDVDVFTPGGYSGTDLGSVSEWISNAHVFEKAAFFQLLPKDLVEELREE